MNFPSERKNLPRYRRSTLSTALAVALAAGAVSTLAAPGELTVTVTDAATGRVVPDVRVTATDRDGNVSTVSSNASGVALFSSLEEGFYLVEAYKDSKRRVSEPAFRLIGERASRLVLEMSDRLELLEEVVVTGVSRAREADPYGPVSGAFRNREELRGAVGAGPDVIRALDGLPGLQSDGEFAAFSVRGRGPRNNLFFVDDFPLDQVVHFDATLGEEEDIGGGGRFSIFAPNSISGAEFTPGGWSAAYGGRNGSLLRLDLAEGGETPLTTLRLDIAGAEFTYDGPSGIHDDTSVYFTARQFDFGRVFEQIDEQDNGSPEVTDVILKTSTALDDKNELQFLLIHAPEKFTRDIEAVLASPDYDDVSLINAEQDLSLLGVTWRRLVGDTGEWTNRVYLRDVDKSASQGEAFPDLVPMGTASRDIPVREDIFRIDEKETEFGWRSDYSVLNKFGTFKTGLRVVNLDADYSNELAGPWIRYTYESDDERPEGQRFVVWDPEQFNSSYARSGTNLAAFAEQTFESGRWTLTPGLRVEQDDFSSETYTSPRLSMTYQASPDLRLSANTGIYYESPRFLVRAANPENFDLANEEVTHFSLGLDYWINDSWRVMAEVYHQDLNDLVVDEGRATSVAANSGDGTSSGLDLVVQKRFGDGWSADFTYFYNDAEFNDNDGAGAYIPDFSREHFFAVGGRWEINDAWQVAARYKWGSGRPGDAFIVHEDVLPGSGLLRYSKEITDTNAITLGDYSSLNLRVDYRRSFGPVDLVAFVDVINITGAENGSAGEFNPRTGNQIPEDGHLFPLIGVIFEKAW
jgi:hypothetical protein